jgi:hypothetical protein
VAIQEMVSNLIILIREVESLPKEIVLGAIAGKAEKELAIGLLPATLSTNHIKSASAPSGWRARPCRR